MDPVEFSFTLTSEDYERSTRAFALRHPVYMILSIAIIVLTSAYIVLSILSGSRGTDPWLLVVVLPCLGLIAPVQLYLLRPYLAGRRFAKQEHKVGQITWRVDDDTIHTESAQSKSTLNWSVFDRAFETRDYIFLVYAINKNLFQIVPKRALKTAEQDTTLRQLIRKHLGPIK